MEVSVFSFALKIETCELTLLVCRSTCVVLLSLRLLTPLRPGEGRGEGSGEPPGLPPRLGAPAMPRGRAPAAAPQRCRRARPQHEVLVSSERQLRNCAARADPAPGLGRGRAGPALGRAAQQPPARLGHRAPSRRCSADGHADTRLSSSALPALTTRRVQGESCARFRCSPTPPQGLRRCQDKGRHPPGSPQPLCKPVDGAAWEAPSAEILLGKS